MEEGIANNPKDTWWHLSPDQEGLEYGGIVEAGAFRSVDVLNQADEKRRVPIPPNLKFPKARQYAFQVRGDSMDQAKILDGMWLTAIDYIDYVDIYRQELKSGDTVIVQRTRHQGSEIEFTVKELKIFRDRFELLPRSSNPSHKPIIIPFDIEVGDRDEEAKILAIVTYSMFLHNI